MTATLELVRSMDDEQWAQASAVLLRWFPTGRPEQKPTGDWLVYAFVAGRGAGKTRTGAEWTAEQAITRPRTRGAIVAPTFADVRDTCIEGESGIGAVLRRRLPGLDWQRAYNRSMAEIVLPNGSRLKGFAAVEPERLRGPQHHYAWADELAAWSDPEAWDQLQFGLRLGEHPCTVVTTTPRPTKLMKRLRARADAGDGVVWVGGSTFDNERYLSAAALAELRSQYEGTRLGRQELHAELLTDTPGALWTQAMIEAAQTHVVVPPMKRIVVAIDPAVTSGEDSDATGIVAVGLAITGELFVLADRTCRESPERWARTAVDLYDELEADRIVAEVNNGGDLVATVLRTVEPAIPVRTVHASRGKRVRAEPVAALYEQGRVHHVGDLGELEDQMTTWTPDSPESPDRLDALVWAVTELAIEQPKRKRRSVVGVGAA